MRFLFAMFLIAGTAQAQSVSVSPTSVKIWGKTPDMGSLSLEFEKVGLHYYHAWRNHSYLSKQQGQWVDGGTTSSSVALSYRIIDHDLLKYLTGKDLFQAGLIVFGSRFPTNKSAHLNFFLDLGYTFRHFRISYHHISNGFGLIHDINPGVDSFVLTLMM